MKKWISTIVLILLVGYVAFAAIAFSDKPAEQVCKGVKLEIVDSLEVGYLNTADVLALLRKSGLDPTGMPMDEVSLRAIEQALLTSPLIRISECYKTINGYVVIDVRCRVPILRVIANSGDSFYLDDEGEVIEHIAKAVYIPIATGHVSREYAQEHLLPLAQYMQTNDLWNAQIEQIQVTARGDIELVPRVGDHVIELGKPGNYAYKLSKLETFYEKGLNQIGWEKYSRINLDYGNQVIGSKTR